MVCLAVNRQELRPSVAVKNMKLPPLIQPIASVHDLAVGRRSCRCLGQGSDLHRVT